MRLTIFIFLISLNASAQISYSGFIGKFPIKLTIHTDYGKKVGAVYAYDKHDTPIIVDGVLNGSTLDLFEREANNKIHATLRFKKFSENAPMLTGEWFNNDSTKRLPISLTREFQVDESPAKRWEIFQRTSTNDHYFKLIVTKSEYGDLSVTGVIVYEKKTDRFIQEFDLECQYLGLDNIDVGDFNFDGLPDFSVFEASYAGPNTTSIYILRIPQSEKYFISEIYGTSLSFDQQTRQITERNGGRAGMEYQESVYELEDNRMKLLSTKCFEYNEDKQKYFETQCQ